MLVVEYDVEKHDVNPESDRNQKVLYLNNQGRRVNSDENKRVVKK